MRTKRSLCFEVVIVFWTISAVIFQPSWLAHGGSRRSRPHKARWATVCRFYCSEEPGRSWGSDRISHLRLLHGIYLQGSGQGTRHPSMLKYIKNINKYQVMINKKANKTPASPKKIIFESVNLMCLNYNCEFFIWYLILAFKGRLVEPGDLAWNSALLDLVGELDTPNLWHWF